ncbi:hypothetical protein BABINDRAFT_160770 [Babjeviella inositovora NRRL Y-12698]|uniref:Uncharacterized protein n=1 Tax=Babjeviella inositovora NRRL Y-12698 TaxID=984486 RepID=A0A1E3QU19_9ASCO|nr:uncharacterized protein BABINDRAFT_160770 [Babjeviella inositovora NRRL Y-12698]ODQ80492.1 hypothetical protein BABINDRAFT_160770 [Babjeviella inositovora NRRL Y-12698]
MTGFQVELPDAMRRLNISLNRLSSKFMRKVLYPQELRIMDVGGNKLNSLEFTSILPEGIEVL